MYLNNSKIIAGYGKCLVKLNKTGEVTELLDGLEEDMLTNKNIAGLIALNQLAKANKLAGSPEEFLADVNANPSNHDTSRHSGLLRWQDGLVRLWESLWRNWRQPRTAGQKFLDWD